MFRRVMIRIFRHGKSRKLTVRPLSGSNGTIGGSGTGFLSGYVADFRFRAKANSRPPRARLWGVGRAKKSGLTLRTGADH
jgi:hypothetical protein